MLKLLKPLVIFSFIGSAILVLLWLPDSKLIAGLFAVEFVVMGGLLMNWHRLEVRQQRNLERSK